MYIAREASKVSPRLDSIRGALLVLLTWCRFSLIELWGFMSFAFGVCRYGGR
jgi:hypothetical protein